MITSKRSRHHLAVFALGLGVVALFATTIPAGAAAPTVAIDTVVTTTLHVFEFTTYFNPPAVDISCEIDHSFAPGGATVLNEVYCMSASTKLTHHVTLSSTGVVRRCVGQMCGSNPGLGTPSFSSGTEVRSGPFVCVISSRAVTCRVHGTRGFVITASAISTL